MQGVATARRRIVSINHWLEQKVGPARTNIHDAYRAALTESVSSAQNGRVDGTSATRALHFGSGRDKHGLGALVQSQGASVIALDPDVDGLKINPANFKVIGDGTKLPFQDESFDLVFSEFTFEHVRHPWDALSEIHRVLKSHGSFVVLVPNRNHYYAWITRMTPFWFHRAYLRAGGSKTTDIDTFPTEYKWGALSDIQLAGGRFHWDLIAVHSAPGPTTYTKWLPIHLPFILLDRVLSRWQSQHLTYVARFRKSA